MNRLLYWLSGFLPCRLINDGALPYLERYYVGQAFGRTFYLHRFVASDPARGLHDHPWSRAFSIVLSGSYWEETRTGRRHIKWFNALTGDTFHRVILPDGYGTPGSVWTLFFHGPYVKKWGFLKPVDISHADGVLMFLPYTYTDRASSGINRWWETAPKGKDSGRLPR